MPISKNALKGYILEEVLAYLIRNAGYKLLVTPEQDPRELDWRGNGLVVKGRGGVHQVDVLGELEWIPAFTYPIRLFLEAKFRKMPVGVYEVRNAIATLVDINQNISPIREQKEFYQRYQYVYALFSTSGFSKSASQLAIAHQISLIDLGEQQFNNLLNSINESADRIYEILPSTNNRIIASIRYLLRKRLETIPQQIAKKVRERLYIHDDLSSLEESLSSTINTARQYGELFVGMANGPFMLLLKADNPQQFISYARERPQHNVMIGWSRKKDEGKTWVITPLEDEKAYRLTFRLPTLLAKWIFESQKEFAETRRRALAIKERFFSSISIYRRVAGRDYLFRLLFDPGYIFTVEGD